MGHKGLGPTLTGLNRRPVYLQLRDAFVERLRSGDWRAHQVLPNEVQLAGAYGVSVGTIRKVMDELSDLGLITRQQGRGTIVNDLVNLGGASPLDLVRNADGSPVNWDSPRLDVVRDQATPEEVGKLRRKNQPCEVLRLTWLRSKNKRPLALQRSVVPLDLGVDIDRVRHAEGLHELFGQVGVIVATCEDAMSVATSDHDIATRLRVADGQPVQRVARRFFDLDGTVVGLCASWLALRDEYVSCTQLLRYDAASRMRAS